MQQKSPVLFKVASILMLVWGVITLIVNVSDLFSAFGLLAMVSGALLFGVILLMVSAVFMVIGGLMGLIGGSNPAKAKTFVILGGLAVCALVVGTIIILAVLGTGVNWIFTIIGLALSCLYIVGALQLKNA